MDDVAKIALHEYSDYTIDIKNAFNPHIANAFHAIATPTWHPIDERIEAQETIRQWVVVNEFSFTLGFWHAVTMILTGKEV